MKTTKETSTAKYIISSNQRLFVLAHGAYLSSEKSRIIVRKNNKEIYSCPFDELKLVFLQGVGMNISVALQTQLAVLDIPVIFAPSGNKQIAVLNGIKSSRSLLRESQILRRRDPQVIKVGLGMIAAKVGNQSATLRYFAKYRKSTNPDLAEELIQTACEIREYVRQINSIDPMSSTVRLMVMGYEGYAASKYCRQLKSLVPKDLGFLRRSTHRADDVVNQCLNYVYGILYGEVWRAVAKAGLDPYFGIIHGAKRDQGSMVFDMIEEFRAPFSDRLVLAMLGRGFQPESSRQGLLKTRIKNKLALAFSKRWYKEVKWHSRIIAPASMIELQARNLAKLFQSEGTYKPYRMRW
jgi:CRISPR-associated protein Cas1